MNLPRLRNGRTRLLFGAAFLASGAALATYVISGISLLAAFVILCAGGAALGSMIWARRDAAGRAEFSSCIRAGIIAGVLATAAYDLSRYVLVVWLGFEFWPFDIFNIFGRALLATNHHGWWVTMAGVCYHFANGVGFSIAYTIWCGRRGVAAGVAWAFVLELFMVTLYPGWLQLAALDEFLQVSILGHVVYGVVLGGVAKKLLLRADEVRE